MSFRKELLPPPRTFYELELGKLGRPNSKGWALGCCPFHESKSGRSFSVNLNSGGFYCFGCDAKGGDVLAFIRRLEGYSFKKAAQILGAWDENGKRHKQHTESRRHLVMNYAVDGVDYRAGVLDEPKSEIDLLRRIHAEAANRLLELRRGDVERFEGETQTQWSIMADSWQLIELEKEEADGR